MKIAIIGGIGSGKSQVTKVAKKLGYKVVSADEINREMLQDQRYLIRVKELFPEAFSSGKFDKTVLSDIIFKNKARRESLNALAHPEIIARMNRITGDNIVFEIPLYLESGCENTFDKILLVHTSLFLRIKRLKGRGVPPLKAMKIICSQVGENKLKKVATDILVNNGTIEELECEATKYFNGLK